MKDPGGVRRTPRSLAEPRSGCARDDDARRGICVSRKKKPGPSPKRQMPVGSSPAPRGWGERLFVAMGHRTRQALVPWPDGNHVSAILSFSVVQQPFGPDTMPDYLHIEIPMSAARQLGEGLIEFARRVEADPEGRTADPVNPPEAWDPHQ